MIKQSFHLEMLNLPTAKGALILKQPFNSPMLEILMPTSCRCFIGRIWTLDGVFRGIRIRRWKRFTLDAPFIDKPFCVILTDNKTCCYYITTGKKVVEVIHTISLLGNLHLVFLHEHGDCLFRIRWLDLPLWSTRHSSSNRIINRRVSSDKRRNQRCSIRRTPYGMHSTRHCQCIKENKSHRSAGWRFDYDCHVPSRKTCQIDFMHLHPEVLCRTRK